MNKKDKRTENPRYRIIGNTKKGFRISDTQTAGMPTVGGIFARKWLAEREIDALEKEAMMRKKNNPKDS